MARKNIESKYHQVTKKRELTHGLIHKKVISKFHREISEIEFVWSKIGKLIKNSPISIEEKIIPRRIIPFFSRYSTKKQIILSGKFIDQGVDSLDR